MTRYENVKNVTQRVTWTEPVSGHRAVSDLTWSDLDPMAVKMVFHYPGEDRVWLFAMDLLAIITEGRAVEAGGCDVTTISANQHTVFILQLSSPFGVIRLHAPMAELTWFVKEVASKLPADGVIETMVDYELAELLKEEGGV